MDSIASSDIKQEISQLADKKEESLGMCLKCKKSIVDKEKFYDCTGYSAGCHFSIQKEIASKKTN